MSNKVAATFHPGVAPTSLTALEQKLVSMLETRDPRLIQGTDVVDGIITVDGDVHLRELVETVRAAVVDEMLAEVADINRIANTPMNQLADEERSFYKHSELSYFGMTATTARDAFHRYLTTKRESTT